MATDSIMRTYSHFSKGSRMRSIVLRRILTIAVGAAAISSVLSASLLGAEPTNVTTDDSPERHAKLRAGYGLYADEAYVASLDISKNPGGYEDFPFPIAPSESQILRRNADVIAAAGDYVAHTKDPSFTDLRVSGSDKPGGLPTLTLLSTEPAASARAIRAESWSNNARLVLKAAPRSRGNS